MTIKEAIQRVKDTIGPDGLFIRRAYSDGRQEGRTITKAEADRAVLAMERNEYYVLKLTAWGLLPWESV